MALTRKMLKAMGIDEDKIEQIIDEHSESISAIKAERDDYKEKAEQLSDIQKQLEKAQRKANKADEWENKYNNYKSEIESKQSKRSKETAYRRLLKDIGISNDARIDKIIRISDLSRVQMEDGKIKNADSLKTDLKKEWSDFIPTTSTKGANTQTPPTTTPTTIKSKADIYAKDDHGRYKLSASERQEALIKLSRTENEQGD